MRILFVLFALGIMGSLNAQRQQSVYTKDGNKLLGNIVSKDSVNKNLRIIVAGGSEFLVPFSTIDSIKHEYGFQAPVYNKPNFGMGMGLALNKTQEQFQFDFLVGYQFTPKFSTGIGLCLSNDYSSTYLDYKYYFFQHKFLKIGAYLQPGLVINTDIDYSYYRRSGFYSNSGLSFQLIGDKSGCFTINTGFQYVKRKETYTNWGGNNVVNISEFNRYILQGIFTF